VFQYNKRDLPNVDTVEDINAYLNPGNAPAVEAAAIQGVGVTATLRAAVARILDNLKNNVDTTLYEEPALTAPDMSAPSGVTPSSAGAPKLSMRGQAAAAEEDPFGAVAVAVDESAADDLFGAVEVTELEPEADRQGIEEMLAGAREVVRSLEAALETARRHEHALLEKLKR
jgi:hypothetical protein